MFNLKVVDSVGMGPMGTEGQPCMCGVYLNRERCKDQLLYISTQISHSESGRSSDFVREQRECHLRAAGVLAGEILKSLFLYSEFKWS